MKSTKKIDVKVLDEILEKMVKTVDDSKEEIYKIGEESRKQYEEMLMELKDIKIKIQETIDKSDKLEVRARFARQRLAEVSQHFNKYSEKEIRAAYENAHALQIDLTMLRQQERELRNRRDDLERRLRKLREVIERADYLVSQITVVLNYLNSDLRQVGEMIENAHQKQEFGLKIIEAQEEERRRLSREIHDGPAQMLANVLMRSDLIERIYRERGVDDAFKEIRDLRKMVRSALYEVRRIIYDLRPMALDDLGLVPTLKKYLSTIEEYSNRTKITFINAGSEKRLPSRLEVALFRLVQESVQNALKHAEANHIQVKIEIGKNHVILVIKDDGKGFDVNIKKENSFGLIGMKERVDLLEGEMTIDSKIGAGTVIMIRVPLTM
jgi:two-component system, NarL family, sensor histidine kinase DegS